MLHNRISIAQAWFWLLKKCIYELDFIQAKILLEKWKLLCSSNDTNKTADTLNTHTDR